MEEAFSCFLVYRPELEVEKTAQFQVDLQAALNGLVPEQQEAGVRQFLNMAAGMTNAGRLQLLLKLLEGVVQNSIVPSRYQINLSDPFKRRRIWDETRKRTVQFKEVAFF